MQLKKLFAALAVSGGLAFTLAGCGDKAPADKGAASAAPAAAELKIGVSPVPHADIVTGNGNRDSVHNHKSCASFLSRRRKPKVAVYFAAGGN